MTREEAITWFENRAKQITLSGAREMYRLAISALRELDEYKKAESEGRLVVLPCKVGDTVWFNTYKGSECIGIKPHKVEKINVLAQLERGYAEPCTEVPDWAFGKTVFLTREEAEKALED